MTTAEKQDINIMEALDAHIEAEKAKGRSEKAVAPMKKLLLIAFSPVLGSDIGRADIHAFRKLKRRLEELETTGVLNAFGISAQYAKNTARDFLESLILEDEVGVETGGAPQPPEDAGTEAGDAPKPRGRPRKDEVAAS